jgi:hypothetical protein
MMRMDLKKQDNAPELFYHVKRTIIDFPQDKSGATEATDIICTFTDPEAADRPDLPVKGYPENDFVDYEDNDGHKEVKHRDGAMVVAKVPAGQKCHIQTTELGSYPTAMAAREAAQNALINGDFPKESFAKYSEKGEKTEEWPHGDDVLVYAVTETGEKIKISVEAKPHSQQYQEHSYHAEHGECANI